MKRQKPSVYPCHNNIVDSNRGCSSASEVASGTSETMWLKKEEQSSFCTFCTHFNPHNCTEGGHDDVEFCFSFFFLVIIYSFFNLWSKDRIRDASLYESAVSE